ncbi:MAG: trypsin-like peptidase domain-containing protein [Hyphomonadaceae bacterium]
MRIPDWLIYTIVLVAISAAVFLHDERRDAGLTIPADIPGAAEPGPGAASETPPGSVGPLLPGPAPLDERVLVQVGDVEDGIGTAFAINRQGDWLTARHVVDGCSMVGLDLGDGRVVKAEDVWTSADSDLALIRTDRAPATVPVDPLQPLRIGDPGYHVGFPQGRSGEVSSRLLARSRLVTRGRYQLDESVLAWVEKDRSDGLEGTLAGMSGGPVFDADGEVVGVTVAESPRRGRIYTAAPDSIARFLQRSGAIAASDEGRPIAQASYHGEADRMRKSQAVMKVVCIAAHSALR